KRNKKVALKHGFEGAWERILLWHGWRVVRIGFPLWRTVPPLFPPCLALISALDRDAQQPFCYASSSTGNGLLVCSSWSPLSLIHCMPRSASFQKGEPYASHARYDSSCPSASPRPPVHCCVGTRQSGPGC